MKLLITGGSGFIGSHFIRLALKEGHKVTNLDKLTYAGNRANNEDYEKNPDYTFVKGDICDSNLIDNSMKGTDAVIHFAAETHVDRSISNPEAFLTTNVIGTYRLLQTATNHKIKRFIHISTDEVYGSIEKGFFKETDAHNPSSPYSASKDAADRLAHAFFTTHNLPVIILRPANTYGPNQYPEKILSLFITNLLENKKVPIYGDGLQRRDWLFVEDFANAVLFLLQHATPGESYNLPGNNELTNLSVTKLLLKALNKDESFIEHVKDRPGHDRRYALDGTKLKSLGWKHTYSFELGLKKTIDWYKTNELWWKTIKNGEFKQYYQKQYGGK